ncbi:FAD-binding oxidoreductase [Microlunatus flavus]|uniref:FAD/FMN-containing dehydrogenase n=1 Tax=Microlunatus flavus TaxID=1036181 RepID=A0A1H9FWB6_9ACTN|nr:FAD-dependent oxidoreductase [Microlunatus flavus]SEQ41758.1 FAD/FMN-containing dehydrogenase [Microlunatus flavus]
MTDLVLPDLARDRLVLPGDPRYAALRSTYTTRHSPALVLLPHDAREVATALEHARSTGLAISVRSGGHGLSGRSSNDGGVVIDLSRLNEVTVLDRASRLVRVGAGARWAEVAGALAPVGLAISAGDHGNVGVGGLATGGGVGWLVRSYGLTVDHVRAVDVVLADGSLVRADADHEPDLYWAMRGGGQGMAVALAFEIEAVELGHVGVAQVVVEADRGGAMLSRWSEVMAAAPRSWSTAMFLAPHGRSFAAQVTAVVADADEAELLGLGQAFQDVGQVLAQQLSMVPYPALVPAAHLHVNLGQQPSHTTNGLFGRLDARASRSLMDVVAHPAQPLLQLRSLGGAVNDVAPDATAYAHRHQEVLATVTTFPPSGRRHLDAAWSEAADLADGAYTNFESEPGPRAHDRAFPGGTGRRLRDLRARFDPECVLGGDPV